MPHNILIFLFGDLGDTILTVPAIRALRRTFPEARLVLLGKDVAASYVLPLGLVHDSIVIEKHLWDHPASILRPAALLRLLWLVRRLRRERFDTVVIFHHLVTRWGALKFALLALVTGAQRRVGLDNGRGWFLTDAVNDLGFGNRHEAQYYLDVAGLLGAQGVLRLEAPISEADRARASDLVSTFSGRRLVAIHPGTGAYGPGRRWEPVRFAYAARLIRASEDVAFVLVGGDVDLECIRAVADQLDFDFVNCAGGTSVGVLAALLERCSLLLANDGGVGHLAAAVGTPVVSIFGPSNDRAWRPLTARVISADLACRPCFYRDFERGLPSGCASRECMDLVSPGAVARAALTILREDAVVG